MKKYLLGLLAITVAFATVAFTPKEDQTMVYFTFIGETDDQTQVATESLWVEDSENLECDDSDKACQIKVSEADVSGDPGGRTLQANTNVQLSAVEGEPNHFIPQKQSGAEILILNKD